MQLVLVRCAYLNYVTWPLLVSKCMEQHCNEEEFQKFLKAEGVTQKLRKKQSWIS